MSEISPVKTSVCTVTPVYKGAEYLEKLIAELATLKNTWAQSGAPLVLVESIFVLDGAIDDSHAILLQMQKEHCWVKVICLSRNYGQHAATVAGICHTSSDWVVTLDEDFQHRPTEIETLFQEQALNATDVVYAQPMSSVHGNSWRDKSSRLVKTLLSKFTNTPQIRLFNSFRLIRGSIARSAASSSSSQTYLDVALSWFTKSCTGVVIDMQDDRFIESKDSGYGLFKLIAHARKLIVSSQLDIASFGLMTGVTAIGVAIFVGLAAVIQKVLFPESIGIQGWASLVTLITFFGGIIISLLCVALEYINIIVINQLGKPTFLTIDRARDHIIVDWYKNNNS